MHAVQTRVLVSLSATLAKARTHLSHTQLLQRPCTNPHTLPVERQKRHCVVGATPPVPYTYVPLVLNPGFTLSWKWIPSVSICRLRPCHWVSATGSTLHTCTVGKVQQSAGHLRQQTSYKSSDQVHMYVATRSWRAADCQLQQAQYKEQYY